MIESVMVDGSYMDVVKVIPRAAPPAPAARWSAPAQLARGGALSACPMSDVDGCALRPARCRLRPLSRQPPPQPATSREHTTRAITA
mmetsp:Transcript_3763/g.11183  ORF Transcript_3763/g.11183 Transcript_3763/m.11183 type:complete len:87 (-) Transcript_3763:617-877(-)